MYSGHIGGHSREEVVAIEPGCDLDSRVQGECPIVVCVDFRNVSGKWWVDDYVIPSGGRFGSWSIACRFIIGSSP